MRAWRPLALAAVVRLVALPASAGPCMDGLPALGHGSVAGGGEGGAGKPERLPVRILPEPGCQATPASEPLPGAGGLVRLAANGFDQAPAGAGMVAWPSGPSGSAGVQWSAADRALRVGPAPSAGGALVAAAQHLDGANWLASLRFKLGTTPEDPQGNGSLTVQLAVIDAGEATTRAGPALRIDVQNAGADGYPVTAPGTTGLVLRDDAWHTLELRQGADGLTVRLDGTVVDRQPAAGSGDECVLVGIGGPAAGGPEADQVVLVDDLTLATIPNEAALQEVRYGLYRPPPPLPSGSGAPVADPCATLANDCCFVEPVSDNYSGYPCTSRCNLEDGAYNASKAPEDQAHPRAVAATFDLLGCKPDRWPERSETATWWPVSDGRNTAQHAPWAGPKAILATTTDTVMYDEEGNTQFSCDVIGGRLLVEMRYDEAALDALGIAEDEVRLHHWDGRQVRALEGRTVLTGLGLLSVHAQGHDAGNDTMWALVSITDLVEGREVNNNFATAKLSNGTVLGNGWMLGVHEPASAGGFPWWVLPLVAGLVGAAGWAAWQRARRLGQAAAMDTRPPAPGPDPRDARLRARRPQP